MIPDDRLILVFVGDLSHIEDEVRCLNFGEVQVLDAAGNGALNLLAVPFGFGGSTAEIGACPSH